MDLRHTGTAHREPVMDRDRRDGDGLSARDTGSHGSHHTGSRGPAGRPHNAVVSWLLRRRPSSSLTRRILAINLLVLAVPVGGFFALDRYQESLIDAEIEALRVQAEVFAAAVGAGAVVIAPGVGQLVDPVRASLMLRRLTEPTQTRARLFSENGALVTDTQTLVTPRGAVQVEELPPTDGIVPMTWLTEPVNAILNWSPNQGELPIYQERSPQRASDYRETIRALAGRPDAVVRRHETGGMVISVSVPVQRYRQVVGALMLSHGSGEIENAMRAIRIDILKVFGVALAVTVLLSIYLAATIARPLKRLAAAAEQVRSGAGRHTVIPDFAGRQDEIGELGRDLRAMTEALWQRMDAIERFAADVSHEIKNPLTSLRSAVETVSRVEDPAQQKKLMSIILDDVGRLDRLISDISDASRLDAELSRDPPANVDLRDVLGALVDIQAATSDVNIVMDIEPGADFTVCAFEDRLGQVFRNIISNAQSFSPPGGRIVVSARRSQHRDGDTILVSVDDEGPGIPEPNLESIFRRFYSDRPTTGPDGKAERLGTHSGLGLSISRQIVEAAGGELWAENRRDADGRIAGARFLVRFPAV